MRCNNFELKRGISLIETVVYVALLGMFAVFLANFLIQMTNTYYRARAEREVISNARLLLETLEKSIAQAQEVYSPTSRFNNDTGQLSLITPLGAQPGHTTAYLDFYLDGGRLWTRPEGQTASPISAASVRVSRLRLERIIQSFRREAVRLTLQVDAAQQKIPASITLNATVAIRGNY